MNKADEFSSVEMIQSMVGYATAGVRATNMFNRFEKRIADNPGSILPKEIVQALWAASELHFHSSSMFKSFEKVIESRCKSFDSEQGLSSLFWSPTI